MCIHSKAGQIFDGWHPLFLDSVAGVATMTKGGWDHFCMDQSVNFKFSHFKNSFIPI